MMNKFKFYMYSEIFNSMFLVWDYTQLLEENKFPGIILYLSLSNQGSYSFRLVRITQANLDITKASLNLFEKFRLTLAC